MLGTVLSTGDTKEREKSAQSLVIKYIATFYYTWSAK